MSDKPITLMPEDIQRLMGKDAQRNNIMAARMVAEVVKTTLGPKGMDKMLVSPTNDIIVTNDGVTILEEMQIEHPAEKLLDRKIHPTIITKGYKIAAVKAQEILKDLSLMITSENEVVLEQVAMTAMTGKGAEDKKEKLAKIIVKAVKQIENKGKFDLNDIKIEKMRGDSVKDAELIFGLVLDKEKVTNDMPSIVHDPKIALIDFPLEIKSPDLDTKISISSPEQLQCFIVQEEESIKRMIQRILDSGANVIFCQKGIDDFAQYLLSKEGVYACRRVARRDLEKISKATGARIVSNLNELNQFELGEAEVIEEVHNCDNVLTFIKGCKNPKALTILIHGGSSHALDEIERALQDGLGDIASCLKTGLVVPGGGAIEIELAKRLREFGQTLSGREQLAIDEFAGALEFIPITLAENAGLDPIDVLTELKSRHDSGEKNVGINLLTNRIENMLESRIIEPSKIKSQAIESASEVATMILRIDDVIASNGKKHEGKMNSMNGGMPNNFMNSLE